MVYVTIAAADAVKFISAYGGSIVATYGPVPVMAYFQGVISQQIAVKSAAVVVAVPTTMSAKAFRRLLRGGDIPYRAVRANFVPFTGTAIYARN